MLTEYIEEALKRAKYEIIDDEEPYYGEVPELKGVWTSGKTLEECREKLIEVIEGWTGPGRYDEQIIPLLYSEDGLHIDMNKKGNYEWWYFDSHLKNGSYPIIRRHAFVGNQ